MDVWIASTFCLLWILLLWMNMSVQVLPQFPALNSSWYIPRIRIAWSYSEPVFNFWGAAILFPTGGCTILYSHQQCIEVPVPPHACEHLCILLCSFFFFFFLIIATLMDVKWEAWVLRRTINISGASLVAQRKDSACQCRRHRFNPWVGKISWRRKWQPTLIFLPGKSHGQRSLLGYSPWGRKQLDSTERLSTITDKYTYPLA